MNLKSLISALALAGICTAATAQTVQLSNLKSRETQVRQGSALGVPFTKGQVQPNQKITLTDKSGATVPSDSWTLAYWPDGSVKWMGVATVSDKGTDELTLNVLPAPAKSRKKVAEPAVAGMAVETAEGVSVNTGAMSCIFPSSGDKFIKDLRIGDKTIASGAELVAILEQRSDNGKTRTVTESDFVSKVEKVSILQNSALRTQIKIEGKHKAVDGSREWLPFALYFIMYKDVPTISMTHSFNYDSDGREDFIKGLGISFEVPFREQDHNRHARFAGEGKDGSGFWRQPVRLAPGYRPGHGKTFAENYQEYLDGKRMPQLEQLSPAEQNGILTCPVWGDMRLMQNSSKGFSIDKRTSANSSWVHVTEGGRSIGGALLGDCTGSLFVGVKDFWQSYPASLDVSNAGSECGKLTAWLWSPYGDSMDMRHYDTVGHDLKVNYEDYKEGWESPYGVGHRSTLEIHLFDNIPSDDELWAVAAAVQKPVQFSCSPEYFYGVHAFGDFWGLPDMSNPVTAKIENQISHMLEYYKQQVEQRAWYGFWNYGDVMHNYDFTRHDWRYDIGGWAWNNVELAPNVLLWISFLRTGREDIWNMAVAQEKHSMEVDVHHIGQFAPLGSRHNVTHWGDGCKQPRIEYAAMKRFMYYLTGGDALTGDLMTEQIGSEKAYEYARRISTWGAVGGTYLKSSMNDWTYYAGNWMIEWERTGKPEYRDKLINSMKDIVALSRPSGRLEYDYFDSETGRFLVYLKEDPSFRGEVNAPASDFVPASTLSKKQIDKIVGYRLSRTRGAYFGTIFGAPELMVDMKEMVDLPEFWKYADNFFRDISAAPGNSMTGPRSAAWVAHSENDEQMGRLAWEDLLDHGFTDTESDGTSVRDHLHAPGVIYSARNVVNPVEDPVFLGETAGWQRHTPSTTQWILNAIGTMEWGKNYVPSK